MGSGVVIAIMCACGQPETAPVHKSEDGHRYAPLRGADQRRDDQETQRGPRKGHNAIVSYRVIVPASVGAGVDVNVVVPAMARWRVQSITAQLVTSAVVANRIPHIVITDPLGFVFYNGPASANQVNGTTQTYVGITGCSPQSFDTVSQIPLPDQLRCSQGFKIAFATTGLDVGDQWSKFVLHVKEWLQF
jgi:hypothetical protein